MSRQYQKQKQVWFRNGKEAREKEILEIIEKYIPNRNNMMYDEILQELKNKIKGEGK